MKWYDWAEIYLAVLSIGAILFCVLVAAYGD